MTDHSDGPVRGARRFHVGVRGGLAGLVLLLGHGVPVLAAAQSDSAPSDPAAIKKATQAIDTKAIVANSESTRNWLNYGLDYANTRYSRLHDIDADNVDKLGLAWTYDLESVHHGVEATPIVVDGVMYVSTPWNIVHAVDVRTGKKIWSHDPQVPREIAYKGCCDVVNRGVAVYQGKVFEATYDGRLIALDAATGEQLWSKDTLAGENPDFSYTITGAPIAVNGKVIIGNGGAEYGVRGYITAYDAATGKRDWRWYTVPGDPSKPFENDAMKRAAKTWDPSGEYWKNGGGGTVWDSMAYDAELNLLYIGTGNGSPWNARLRSPSGGDNLFLSSVVALNPDTGKMAWYYQETPADNSDYTATQTLILADLEIDGKKRKVLLHAPKNGFFFVIDRTDGEFISAKKYVDDVNWATGYDQNGRPIETEMARPEHSFDAIPGPYGGHNWSPMSYNPDTGLAYFPAQNVPVNLTPDPNWERGVNDGEPQSDLGWNLGFFLNAKPPQSVPFGRVVAWDPVKQKQVWSHSYPIPWNGGTLTTAGNLVFQGTADGRLIAFNAKNGKILWQTKIGQGAVAGPVTYAVDGQQYVSLAVGWGGVGGFAMRATDHQGPGRVFTFVLGGDEKTPDFNAYPMEPLITGVEYDPADVKPGQTIYVQNCVICHGVPGVGKGGSIPNLGHVGAGVIENLDRFVFDGPYVSNGMPDFTGKLSQADVRKLQAFIQGTADSIRKQQQASAAKAESKAE